MSRKLSVQLGRDIDETNLVSFYGLRLALFIIIGGVLTGVLGYAFMVLYSANNTNIVWPTNIWWLVALMAAFGALRSLNRFSTFLTFVMLGAWVLFYVGALRHGISSHDPVLIVSTSLLAFLSLVPTVHGWKNVPLFFTCGFQANYVQEGLLDERDHVTKGGKICSLQWLRTRSNYPCSFHHASGERCNGTLYFCRETVLRPDSKLGMKHSSSHVYACSSCRQIFHATQLSIDDYADD